MDKQRIVFRHDLHIALWNWLSQNPAKNKENWPGWKGMGKVRYHSFACDAAHKMGVAMLGRDHPNPCMICPLHFIGGTCLLPRSWQHAWYGSRGNSETRIKIAKMMRDTPLSTAWGGLVMEDCHE